MFKRLFLSCVNWIEVKRNQPRPVRRFRPSLEAFEDRTVPANIGWDGGGDGFSFGDALNWDLDVVPGPNDDASIPYIGGSVGGTSASVRSLTSEAPLSFLGGLSLQVSGAFASDLTVNGTFALAAGGDLTFQNGMAALGAASFGDGATGDFSSGWLAGNIALGTGATLHFHAHIYLSGVNITGAAGLTTFTDHVHINGPVSIASVVDLNDTLEVDWDSQLILTGGGSVSGSINIGANGHVRFAGGTSTLESGAELAGDGWAHVSAATVNTSGVVNVDRLELDGIIGGFGKLTVEKALNWIGGQVLGNGGGDSVEILDEMYFTAIQDPLVLNGRILDNKGVSEGHGSYSLGGGAQIVNHPGAVFDILGDNEFSLAANANGTEKFTNAGTLRKMGGAPNGRTFMALDLDNVGVVEAQVGKMELAGDGTHEGGFAAQGSAILDFNDGNHMLQNGTVFSGTGTVRIRTMAVLDVANGATVFNNGNLTLATGGTLKGGGIAATNGQFINQGYFKWLAGTMDRLLFDNGTIGVSGLLHLTGTGLKQYESTLLRNFSSLIWDGGNIVMQSTFNNAWIVNFALFDVQTQNGTILKGAGNAQKIINDVDPMNNLTGQFLVTGPYGGIVAIDVHVQNNGLFNAYGHQLLLNGGTSGDGEWYW